MLLSPLIITIKNNEIIVFKKTRKEESVGEIARISIKNESFDNESVDSEDIWHCALDSLRQRFGKRTPFVFELPQKYIQIQWLERPVGVMKSEYSLFIPALVAQWFDLPIEEICFDYRLDQKHIIVVGAPKFLVETWQNRFHRHKIRVVAIGAVMTSTCHVLGSHQGRFNLLPWREKRAFLLFRCHVVCFSLGLILVAWGVFYSAQSTRQKITLLREKTKILKSEYRKQKKVLTEIDTLHQQWKTVDSQFTRSKARFQHNQRIHMVFLALTQDSLPVTLEHAIYDHHALTLRGSAERYDAIKHCIAQLRHFPFIQEAKLTQLVRTSSYCLFEAYLKLIRE